MEPQGWQRTMYRITCSADLCILIFFLDNCWPYFAFVSLDFAPGWFMEKLGNESSLDWLCSCYSSHCKAWGTMGNVSCFTAVSRCLCELVTLFKLWVKIVEQADFQWFPQCHFSALTDNKHSLYLQRNTACVKSAEPQCVPSSVTIWPTASLAPLLVWQCSKKSLCIMWSAKPFTC